jgi:hypothetical protein
MGCFGKTNRLETEGTPLDDTRNKEREVFQKLFHHPAIVTGEFRKAARMDMQFPNKFQIGVLS